MWVIRYWLLPKIITGRLLLWLVRQIMNYGHTPSCSRMLCGNRNSGTFKVGDTVLHIEFTDTSEEVRYSRCELIAMQMLIDAEALKIGWHPNEVTGRYPNALEM